MILWVQNSIAQSSDSMLVSKNDIRSSIIKIETLTRDNDIFQHENKHLTDDNNQQRGVISEQRRVIWMSIGINVVLVVVLVALL